LCVNKYFERKALPCLAEVTKHIHYVLISLLFRAYKYYKKYVTDLRFDNIYITSYFKKVDARRKLKVESKA